MNESKPKPLHIVLGILAVIAAAVIYTVGGSKSAPDPEEYTPEAYGVEKLEAEAPPAMQIAVWQRNDKDRVYYERNYYDKTFYDMIELPMEVGGTVRTISENSFVERSDENTEAAMQILFDGPISGRYELGYSTALHFSGDNDIMPFNNPDAFHNDNASFSWNDLVTISVYDIVDWVYRTKTYDPTDWHKNAIAACEQAGGFDIDDYLVYEKITDVYSDVPEEFQDLYRAVTTTHLYLYGHDSVKQDIVLAEAVLELKSYSRWIGLDAGEPEYQFELHGFENKSYTDVTVVSYTQSDSYAME